MMSPVFVAVHVKYSGLEHLLLHYVRKSMAFDLYVGAVPTSKFELTACNSEQLDQLEQQAVEFAERVRCTRKGGSIIASLISRSQNRQFVRCTNQSVRTTAGARYDPGSSEFDLSTLSIVCFIGIVTYLPLPSIKSLIANESATRWAEQMWQGKEPDTRWGAYYTCLTSINPVWASLFVDEVQALTGGAFIQQMHDGEMTGVSQDQQISRSDLGEDDSNFQIHDSHVRQLDSLQNEGLLRRVIKAKTLAWDPGHPTTIESVVHLANLHVDQKRSVEARALLLQLFRDWKTTETKCGPEVTNLLTCLAEIDCQLDIRA